VLVKLEEVDEDAVVIEDVPFPIVEEFSVPVVVVIGTDVGMVDEDISASVAVVAGEDVEIVVGWLLIVVEIAQSTP
jgi:hypothetical protein